MVRRTGGGVMAAIPPNNNLEGLISSLKDGIYGAYNKGVKYGRYLALQEYLERKEAAQPKWISVEERLPLEDETVLAYRDGCCGVARLLDVEPVIMWTYTGFGGDPTHWMPLPEAPKEEM